MQELTNEVKEEYFKKILNHFLSLKFINLICADKAQMQFSQFIETEVKLNQDKFINFNKKDKRLDHFYFRKIKLSKYDEFAFILKVILTLSHGQASIERGFSQNNACIANNMKEESMVAR